MPGDKKYNYLIFNNIFVYIRLQTTTNVSKRLIYDYFKAAPATLIRWSGSAGSNVEPLNVTGMNAMKNKVHLVGNLGADPEVKVLESGKKLARFRLATTEYRRDAEGKTAQEVQWHQLVAWGKLADVAERFLKKGSGLVVEGKLSYRNYEDAQGTKRYFTEIVVNDLVLMPKQN
jgi:single-strand DNA-binding protein